MMQPMATKTKAGRPRLGGERYPSGDRRPSEIAPALLRRMVDQAKAKAGDPRWGEPLGVMLLAEEITSAEYLAGREYVDRKAKYGQAIASPSGTARSPGLEVGLGKSPDPHDERSDREARKAAEKARRRHFAGRDAILALPGGMPILDVLERVCVYQHQPTWAEKLWMREGLKALVRVYQQAKA